MPEKRRRSPSLPRPGRRFTLWHSSASLECRRGTVVPALPGASSGGRAIGPHSARSTSVVAATKGSTYSFTMLALETIWQARWVVQGQPLSSRATQQAQRAPVTQTPRFVSVGLQVARHHQLAPVLHLPSCALSLVAQSVVWHVAAIVNSSSLQGWRGRWGPSLGQLPTAAPATPGCTRARDCPGAFSRAAAPRLASGGVSQH